MDPHLYFEKKQLYNTVFSVMENTDILLGQLCYTVASLDFFFFTLVLKEFITHRLYRTTAKREFKVTYLVCTSPVINSSISEMCCTADVISHVTRIAAHL